MSEKTAIPWVGYKSIALAYTTSLERNNFHVKKIRTALEGIEDLKEQNYPLVILKAWPDYNHPEEEPQSPLGISKYEYTQITCHTIQQIRALPQYVRAPILVVHYFRDRTEDLKEFRRAGATDSFSLTSKNSTKGLVTKVRELLGINK